MHKMLYEKALKSVNLGKDIDLDSVQVCEVCGYPLEGEASEISVRYAAH